MMGPEKKPITKLLIKSSYNLSSSVNLSKMPKSPLKKKFPPSLKDKQATEKKCQNQNLYRIFQWPHPQDNCNLIIIIVKSYSTTEAGPPQWRCRQPRCTEATRIIGQP